MSFPFEKNYLAGIELRNRFVRSATYEGMANPDGLVTPELIAAMAKLAEGETGLIISGHAYVSFEGRANQLQMAADRDECIPGLTKIAAAVHKNGGKIIAQLAHAGAQAKNGETATGPSPIKKFMAETVCRKMSPADINRIINAFAAAAARTREAGFDGVQLHAAHGYLLSQFLSPHYNKRTDEYGGGLTGRSRVILEILKLIKAKCGPDYLVMIKINSDDFMDNGFSRKDCLKTCALLEKNGIDAIELSGGTVESRKGFEPIRKADPAGKDKPYYFHAAKEYKEKIKVPLILVGGIRSYENAEKLLETGICDYISLCRPLIREPGLVKRWHSGDTAPAKCISCNLCMRPILTGKSLYCAVEEKLKRKISD
ncbi:MAG: NADH:flavin oxidoreductase [Victivallaceae bacterium]|nr:NADH:flavin oxidoreductase [Victivallaceae bacterium]